MFLKTILILIVGSLASIFLYQHMGLIFFSSFKKNKIQTLSNDNNKNELLYHCDILIASHNEGKYLIKAISSLLQQKGGNKLHIRVLLKNDKDNSYLDLQSLLQDYPIKTGTLGDTYIINNLYKVSICFTGHTSKKDKINSVLSYLQSDFIGFLDADHIAHPNWINESLGFLLTNKEYVGVQGKRGALSLSNVFQLWDSQENHILNEFYNQQIFSKKGLVFFTGTTAIFHSSLFKKRNFSSSLTEDTYLSYDIITDGYKIGYLAHSGSREFVSPDLVSYIARRRRRANGHTQSFFEHIKRIVFSSLSPVHKTQIIRHGLFYVIAISSFVVIMSLGAYTMSQYSLGIQKIIITISSLIGITWSLRYNKGIKNFLFDTLCSTIWLIPHISLFAILILYLINHDLYFYLISLTYHQSILGYSIIYLYFLPLILSLYIWIKSKTLTVSQSLFLIISYPFSLFFGLYAVFIGLCDLMVGNKNWKPIKREFSYTHILYLIYKFKYIILIVLWVGLFFILQYGTKYISCSQNSTISYIRGLITDNNISWENSLSKTLIQSGSQNLLLITYTGSYEGSQDQKNIVIKDESNTILTLDTKIAQVGAKKNYQIQEYFDLGFTQQERTIQVGYCQKQYNFTTSHITIQSGNFLLNGEQFIMKGIVPSFAQGGVNIPMDKGYQQISDIGANLVRSYHKPTNKSLNITNKIGLLLFPQPNKSTRDNAKIYQHYGYTSFIKRFKDLNKKVGNNPFLFSMNIGNEMDFLNHNNITQYIMKLISDIQNNYKAGHLITYASYKIIIDYAVDFLSINMLDSGFVYRNDIIAVLQSTNKPFIASELGGFVAFYEETPEPLRAYRLLQQRTTLLQQGGDGGIIFQSHDNWSQPLFNALNDPLEPEQPDDKRGIRDKYNKPKLSYYIIKDLFSDIAIDIPDKEAGLSGGNIVLLLSNKRPYTLENISFSLANQYNKHIGNLKSGDKTTLEIPSYILSGNNTDGVFAYTTHHGLPSKQIITLPSKNLSEPYILGEGRLPITHGKQGGIIIGSHLRFFIPPHQSMICDGQDTFTGYYELDNYSPIITGAGYFTTNNDIKNNIQWMPIASRNNSYNDNNILLKIQFTSPIQSGDILLLDNLGTEKIKISPTINNLLQSQGIKTHNYRENIIDLNSYVDTKKNYNELYIHIGKRNNSKFLLTQNQGIDIILRNPVIFRPKQCEFKNNK